jgi:hypothetical protein
LPGKRRRVLAGCVALAALAAPSAAHAQYTPPPPAPGFHYIFDGTATGSDASFDKWKFASGTLAQSATQGQATLNAAEGSFLVGASPFGSYWYTPRSFGNVVFRIQYQIENTPAATPNGGIMIRAPYFAYTGATTNDVLAQKPTGFNYDVCGGALAFCNRTTAGASTTYNWAGAPGPFPPGVQRLHSGVRVHGRLLRAPDDGGYIRRQRHQRPAADRQRQREQPPALDAGLLRPRDPDQRVADRRRPEPVDRPDQDRLGLRLPQPQREAVGDV